MKNKTVYPLLVIYFLSFLLIFSSCDRKARSAADTFPDTRIEWKQKNRNFGELISGETVTHTFSFKNTGDQNLIIKNIETACGCTTVTYDKVPVSPGKEGKIEIAFNSEGRYGKQYKEIRIFANVPEKVVTLSFTANVKEGN